MEEYKNGLTVQPSKEALAATVEEAQARAIAEVQAAMAIAKRFPRNILQVQDRIENACTRIGLAQAALYEYVRGGTSITGPSIRLAEAIAQCYGNLDFGVIELDQRNGASTVMAYAWDLESNTRQTKTFQVPHKRYTKKGSYGLEDPRDIYEQVANQGARRLRACVLGVIPGDLVELATMACEKTLRTKADVTPERIAALLTKFAVYGVTKQMIEKRIQKHLDAISPAQMILMGKIYNSLQDGQSVPSEWFDMPEAPKPTDSLKEKLKKQVAPPPPAVSEGPPAVSEGPPAAKVPAPAHREQPKPKRSLEPSAIYREISSMILDNQEVDVFEEFLAKVAAKNNMTREEIEHAVDDQNAEHFLDQYQNFKNLRLASPAPVAPPKQEEAPPEDEPEPEPEEAPPESQFSDFAWTPERIEEERLLYKDKKTSGFTQYLIDKQDDIPRFPQEIRDELTAKCRKIFGSKRSLFETVRIVTGHSNPDPAQRPVPNSKTLVPCPDADGDMMDPEYCNTECSHRQGCPSWPMEK